MLKVIGAGLGRTGTMSLKRALEEIGFGPCYHMHEVFLHEHHAMWNNIVETPAPDWDKAFEGYVSTVDWPACNYYRELMVKYPHAKVILSMRSPESWFASTQATIFQMIDQAGAPGSPMRFAHKLVTDIVGPDLHDRTALITAFERWNADVIASVPKEKLLVFEAKQGWKPLCDFLGAAVPKTPYPETNTTEEFQARMAGGPPRSA